MKNILNDRKSINSVQDELQQNLYSAPLDFSNVTVDQIKMLKESTRQLKQHMMQKQAPSLAKRHKPSGP